MNDQIDVENRTEQNEALDPELMSFVYIGDSVRG